MADALSATFVAKSRSRVRKKAIEVISMAGCAFEDLVKASYNTRMSDLRRIVRLSLDSPEDR